MAEPAIVTPAGPPPAGDGLSILNIRNILTVAVVALVFYLLWLIRGVLVIFMAAMVIAFLLYPVVQWLARIPLGRVRKLGVGPSILLIYLVITAILALIGLLVTNLVQEQISLILESLRSGVLEQKAEQLKAWLLTHSQLLQNLGLVRPEDPEENIRQFVDRFFGPPVVQDLVTWAKSNLTAKTILETVLGGVTEAIVVLISLPILVFYMIIDAKAIRTTLMGFVPPAFEPNATGLLANLEKTLNNYLRGQIKLGFSIFILDAILLLIFVPEVSAWLLISLIAGVTEIIPVVGPTIALVVALMVAGIETGGDLLVLGKIALIFTGVQMIENQLLVPRIMGDQLDVHPLTVMFFLLAGGILGGVIGALLSLPVAATLKVVMEQYYPAFIRRVQALLTDSEEGGGDPPLVVPG